MAKRWPDVGAHPDLKKQAYDLGKEILGQKAGGQVTKLIRYHGGDMEATLFTLRRAQKAANAAEYIGRIVSGERTPEIDWKPRCRMRLR